MKSMVNIFSALLLISCLAACNKGEKLTPSTKKEDTYSEYSLPQGNHSYDAQIVQLFQQYNTLFLYKYVSKDLYYQTIQYSNGAYDPVKDSTTLTGYFDVPADQAYVGQQLALLKDIWFKFYPDAIMKTWLPKKVFLLDSFYFAYAGPGKPSDNWPTLQDTYQGSDFFAVTWGGARLTAITAAEKYAYKSTLNSLFLNTAHQRGLIQTSASFSAVTDYLSVTYGNYLDMGVIDYYRRSPDQDWEAFVEMIVSNSYKALTDPGGMLDPSVDTSGLILKKYNIVEAYYLSTYGIDLQAIGNAGA